ncbi:MAG: hypothetical protein NC453_21880 [Muribaculum sp.]|nr:hypothetical protein [Muribaculum sp.]
MIICTDELSVTNKFTGTLSHSQIFKVIHRHECAYCPDMAIKPGVGRQNHESRHRDNQPYFPTL